MRRVSTAGCSMGPIANQLGSPIYYASQDFIHRFTEGPAPSFSPTIEDLPAMPFNFARGLGTDDGFGGGHSLYVADSTSIYAFDLNTLSFGSNPILGQVGQAGYADGTGGAARFTSIMGLAAAPSWSRLYVLDRDLSAIREVDTDTLAVSTKIGAADIVDRVDGSKDVARLTLPLGLAADASGALYIADAASDSSAGKVPNSTIRLRDPQTGAISSFAGVPAPGGPIDGPAGVARFGWPFDVLRDGADLYVADALARAIRKVANDGSVTTIAGEIGIAGTSDGFGIAAHFAQPTALIADHKGNLYVADVVAIRKITLATGEVTTIAGGTMGSANGVGKNAQFQGIWGLAIDGDTLYIADAADNTIRAMDLGTAEVKPFVGTSDNSGYVDGDYSKALFDHPARLVADGLGNLFVAELGPQF